MRDYLGWGDLSFEFGLFSAGLTYFMLARRNPLFRMGAENVEVAADAGSRSV
jgi:NCS1 family nucleobase:cation symporter-1